MSTYTPTRSTAFQDQQFSIGSAVILILVLGIFQLLSPAAYPVSWDVLGYYLYLPAAFIHGDLGLQDLSPYREYIENHPVSSTFYQLSYTQEGQPVIRYTMGMALLYLPFFLSAHLYSLAAGLTADGFAAQYQHAISLGSFIYMAGGLLILRRCLRFHFSDPVSGITLFLIVAGTNFFHLATWNGPMPHVYLFSLYGLIIWSTIRVYKNVSSATAPGTVPGIRLNRWFFLLALACGLCILIRPTEAVCLLIPLGWGIRSVKDIKDRFILLMHNKFPVALFALIIVVTGLPQLIYWKHFTGEFFYDSYNNASEGLDLLSPHTFNFLFSFRKGWLVYTPLMVFALCGLILANRQQRIFSRTILIFFLFNLYLVSSWSNWWYADSFSQRAMVQSYAALAFPLAVTVQFLGTLRTPLRIATGVLAFLIICLNLFQTWQAHHGILHLSRMTWPYYKAIFGATAVDPDKEKLLLISREPHVLPNYNDTSRYRSATWYIHLPEGTFSEDSSGTWAGGTVAMDTAYPYIAVFARPFEAFTSKDHLVLRVSADIKSDTAFMPSGLYLAAKAEYKGRGYGYRDLDLLRHMAADGSWRRVEFIYLTPELRTTRDIINLHFWRQGEGVLQVRRVKVEVLEPVG